MLLLLFTLPLYFDMSFSTFSLFEGLGIFTFAYPCLSVDGSRVIAFVCDLLLDGKP